MKKFFKNNLIIIIIVAVFLLAAGIGIFFVVRGMTKQQEDIEKQVKNIDEKYKQFSDASSAISEKRTKIYNEVFNNVYYVDFSSKDESWKTNFNEYYELINNVHNDYKDTITICKKYNFIYESTKQKCESIIKYYEILINNYVTDYKLYNENIKKYNAWTNSNTNYKKLDEFVSKGYKEYVDYNGNGEIEHY